MLVGRAGPVDGRGLLLHLGETGDGRSVWGPPWRGAEGCEDVVGNEDGACGELEGWARTLEEAAKVRGHSGPLSRGAQSALAIPARLLLGVTSGTSLLREGLGFPTCEMMGLEQCSHKQRPHPAVPEASRPLSAGTSTLAVWLSHSQGAALCEATKPQNGETSLRLSAAFCRVIPAVCCRPLPPVPVLRGTLRSPGVLELFLLPAGVEAPSSLLLLQRWQPGPPAPGSCDPQAGGSWDWPRRCSVSSAPSSLRPLLRASGRPLWGRRAPLCPWPPLCSRSPPAAALQTRPRPFPLLTPLSTARPRGLLSWAFTQLLPFVGSFAFRGTLNLGMGSWLLFKGIRGQLVRWTPCSFHPHIHILKPQPPRRWRQEVGLWEVIRSGRRGPHEGSVSL